MSFTVTFNLDSKATRTSGGTLTQTVVAGGTAVAPTIANVLGFVFLQWDTALGPINADTTITAEFEADNNILTICEAIATAIQSNAAVAAYCSAKFSKQPNYYIGFDGRKPPADDKVPYVAVVPSATAMQDGAHEEHSIMIGVVCTDGDTNTTSGRTKYIGYKTISDFERVVFDAVQAYLDEQIVYYSLLSWGQASYQGFLPEYHATREITVVTQS